MAYGLKVLANLFAVRGHALNKWLFFRFAEGVRPYKPPYSRSAGSGQFVKAADPEKQTLLRLDPLLPTRTKAFAITLNTYYGRAGNKKLVRKRRSYGGRKKIVGIPRWEIGTGNLSGASGRELELIDRESLRQSWRIVSLS